MFRQLREVFHGKGHKYYKSQEAQRKFADSTLKMAEMLFLAPIAYLISIAWSGDAFQGWVIAFVIIFMVLGLKARHDALIMYDDINGHQSEGADGVDPGFIE